MFTIWVAWCCVVLLVVLYCLLWFVILVACLLYAVFGMLWLRALFVFVVLVAFVLLVCCLGLHVLVLVDLLGLGWVCGFECLRFVGGFGSCCVMFCLVLVF